MNVGSDLQDDVIIETDNHVDSEHHLIHCNEPNAFALEHTKEPLPSLQSHCKSKTFIAQTGTNPLTATASALFSLISKLRQASNYEDIDALRKSLVHEIKAFQWAAQSRGYSGDEILVARYAICATLDEIIQNTIWGEKNHWQQKTLLHYFQGEIWGGERFFIILERLREAPKRYIDLLEFVYICLSLGFEGKFRVIDKGKEHLENIIDELYHIICNQRHYLSHKLSKNHPHYLKPSSPIKSRPSVWITLMMSLIILTLLYGSYNYMTHMTIKPIFRAYHSIAAMEPINDES